MFERNNDKPNERAQVGIGTLIVFIAMVLVAAIAAGVLINTAGFLQSSAEESGQQAGEQVTNRLQVVNTIGQVDQGNDVVDTVEVTVKQAPGASNIDLKAVIAQWTGSAGASDLTYDSDSTDGDSPTSADEFTIETIVDDEGTGSITVLDDPEDRVKILFDASSISSGNNGLAEGGSATIQLNTQSGGTTTVTITVPETLSGSSAVQI